MNNKTQCLPVHCFQNTKHNFNKVKTVLTFPELSIPFTIPIHKRNQLNTRQTTIHQTKPSLESSESDICRVSRYQKYSVDPVFSQIGSKPVLFAFKGHSAYGKGFWVNSRKVILSSF